MGFKISDAWVDVEFRVEDAEAKISKALAGKNVKVKVDVDESAADSALARLAARASRVFVRSPKLDVDTAGAGGKLTALQVSAERVVSSISGRSAEVKVTGNTADLDRKLALLNAKSLKIDADTDAAGKKLDLLEAQAKTATGDRKLRVDADIAAAKAKLAGLDADAIALENQRVQIQADVDAAGAVAELAVVSAEVSHVDGRRANVTVDADVGSALAKLALVSAAIAGLGGVAVAGLGLAAGAGAIAASGIGAFAASLTGVGGAVKALGESAKAAGGSAGGAARNHNQLASAIDRVKTAQAALKNANLDAASAQARSTASIEEATRRLADVRDSGSRAAQQAAERTAAAVQHEQVAVESLERAQEDLTRARKDAARQIEDLESKTRSLGLAEREAQNGVEDAKKALDRLGSRADAEARERAQLAYEEALARLDDIHTEQKRTADDKADADKKGVDGSDQVLTAQDRILAIQREITAAQQATNDARAAEAQVAKKSAEDIAEATRRLTAETLAAADQRRHSEASVAQAAQAVVEAQRAVQNASERAGAGGAAAMNKLHDAMKGLSPTAVAFAKFLRGFIDGPLADLRKTGQENLLPGLQRGLVALEPILDRQVNPALGRFSKVLGEALQGAIPIAGRLTASILNFGAVSLRGLAPMQGVLDRLATRLDATFTRLERSGDAEKAMNGLVQIIGAFADAIPPIVEGAVQLAVALGPGLTAVAQSFSGQLTGLVGLFVTLAPEINSTLTALAPFIPAIVAVTTAFSTLRSLSSGVVGAIKTIGSAFGGAGKEAEAGATSVGKFSGFLGGPWGIAITGATLLLGAWITKHAEAKQRVAELTAAIEQDSGALGVNTRQKVTNALESDGALKAAKALGISLSDLTDAALGNADAQSRVNAALTEARQHGVWKSDDIGEFAGNLAIVSDALHDQTGAVNDAKGAYQRSREAGGQYSTSLDGMARKSRDATTATDRLNTAMKKITDGFLSGREAENQFNESVIRASASAKENGRTLDKNTEQGIANRRALDGIVSAGQAYIQSMIDQKQPAAAVQAQLDVTRAKLIEAATRFGMGGTEAKKYADKILGVPTLAKTTVRLDGVAEAIANLNGLTQRIAIVNGQYTAIQTRIGSGNDREGRTAVGARALGGPVEKGKPYLVGERHAELFVPDQAGRIIPDFGLPRRPAGNAQTAAPIAQVGGATPQTITIQNLNVDASSAFKNLDALSPVDRMKFIRFMRDELVKLEAGTK